MWRGGRSVDAERGGDAAAARRQEGVGGMRGRWQRGDGGARGGITRGCGKVWRMECLGVQGDVIPWVCRGMQEIW